VRGLKQGPPVDAPIEMKIVGPGLPTLRALGEEARRLMAGSPHITHTRATCRAARPSSSSRSTRTAPASPA
jgi:multidrug efflux pump